MGRTLWATHEANAFRPPRSTGFFPARIYSFEFSPESASDSRVSEAQNHTKGEAPDIDADINIRGLTPFLPLLIFAATLLAYWPALHNGFIWNDPDYVTRANLRSWGGLGQIWFKVGATEQYYPALHSAFWIEHRLWGDAALGYHLANVLLHATAAFLFAFILRRLGVPGSWLGGLIFALHPVCVESVAWISEQKNTLSTVFYLLAALAYLRFDKGRGQVSENDVVGSRHFNFRDLTPSYWLATALFILALLSKSVTATLPAALLVIIWWRNGRLSWRRDATPLLPWFAAGAAGGLFTAWVERRYIGAEGGDFALSFPQRALVAGRAVWFYLGKLAWPSPLTFIYPRWTVDPSAGWQYVFPAGLLAALACLWLLRGRTRAPIAAALLFMGSLFPVLGFFNVYAFVFSFVADHFQYLACLGVIAIAAAGADAAARKLPCRIGWVAAAAILCLLGTRTWRQCRRYHDIVTFYRTILEDNPASWLAHYNLGNILLEQGRMKEAIAHYEATLQAKADDPQTENNLGLALFGDGRIAQAIIHYRQSLLLRPVYAEAHNNLGNALRALGRGDQAMLEYETAIRLKPDYAQAEYNLGLALRSAGRDPEAISHFKRAILLKPDFAEAFYDLGNSLRNQGDLAAAVTTYETALRMRPDYPDALNNLGNVLLSLGRTGEAVARFKQALRMQPDSAVIHNDLGVALAGAGRMRDAIAEFAKAARLDPAVPTYRRNLALALRQAPR